MGLLIIANPVFFFFSLFHFDDFPGKKRWILGLFCYDTTTCSATTTMGKTEKFSNVTLRGFGNLFHLLWEIVKVVFHVKREKKKRRCRESFQKIGLE